jgi:hypothetical protein
MIGLLPLGTKASGMFAVDAATRAVGQVIKVQAAGKVVGGGYDLLPGALNWSERRARVYDRPAAVPAGLLPADAAVPVSLSAASSLQRTRTPAANRRKANVKPT